MDFYSRNRNIKLLAITLGIEDYRQIDDDYSW